jgi:hypothetical protein
MILVFHKEGIARGVFLFTVYCMYDTALKRSIQSVPKHQLALT